MLIASTVWSVSVTYLMLSMCSLLGAWYVWIVAVCLWTCITMCQTNKNIFSSMVKIANTTNYNQHRNLCMSLPTHMCMYVHVHTQFEFFIILTFMCNYIFKTSYQVHNGCILLCYAWGERRMHINNVCTYPSCVDVRLSYCNFQLMPGFTLARQLSYIYDKYNSQARFRHVRDMYWGCRDCGCFKTFGLF
jgi:hypothetical protein